MEQMFEQTPIHAFLLTEVVVDREEYCASIFNNILFHIFLLFVYDEVNILKYYFWYDKYIIMLLLGLQIFGGFMIYERVYSKLKGQITKRKKKKCLSQITCIFMLGLS